MSGTAASLRNYIPGNVFSGVGRMIGRYTPERYNNYVRDMYNRLRGEYEGRIVPPPTTATDAGLISAPLQVTQLELYARDNANEHNTSKYELVQGTPAVAVLRRGQAFYIAIRTDRPYDPTQDILRFRFSFGPNPLVAKGTRIEMILGNIQEFTKKEMQWDVRIHNTAKEVLTVHIKIPASVCVGVWKCEIETSLASDVKKKEIYKCKENIYVLFNPWCKEDPVYMDNDQWRQEYILNDTGKIYVGPYSKPQGRRWVFGQFDDVVLPACIYILDIAKLDFTSRGNPVKVVRAIAAAANSIDEDGVLEGNWSGNYSDGTAPYAWTGSVNIFEKYMGAGGKPVKYGQCWVFSGVVTTICRALGIPCRSVTNFVSAHDTDESLSIDEYFDPKGNKVPDACNDSIWNFHVWNDVWMARSDLPTGYGGWQAIDSTPQEQSEEIYQAGPASVVAIRRGEIGLLYDTPFIFAEVNADVIHWQEDNKSDIGFRKMRTNNYHVGRAIMTKRPDMDDDDGDDDAENITSEYKDPEGTHSERMAVLNAARCGGLQHIYDMPQPDSEDVTFDLIEIDKIKIGEPFNVNVKIENKSNETRTIQAVLSTASIFYTGVQAKKVKKVDGNFTLDPQQSEMLGITVKPEEYMDKLVDYSMMKIYAIAVVKETRQTWTEEDDFAVEKPKLQLEVQGAARVGESVAFDCTFTNPLNKALRDCYFTFEGPGLTRPITVKFRKIQPLEEVRHIQKFIPTRSGDRKLVATFNSNLLKDIFGSRTIQVAE